jgi:epoxyqueuosine reductase QueG
MRILRRVYLSKLIGREAELARRPDWVQASTGSPARFDIMLEGLKRAPGGPAAAGDAMRHMLGSMWGIYRSLQSVDGNPAAPKTRMPSAELAELEAFAHSVRVDDTGYARLSGTLVFEGKAVLHRNAIVLTMEMDKRRIDTSPSRESFVAVHETYHNLGDAANQIAGWLRKRGYSAQAGHPLMGLALYPPLAQQAGLGWRGMNGLLITPRFGPRVRLAAVFTSVENLPVDPDKARQHLWIEKYCALCRRCASECPPQAILDPPREHDSGLVSCVDAEACFPYFFDYYGCSICIRVCPFQEREYSALKRSFDKRNNRIAR